MISAASRRILIVEDEMMIALMLKDMLGDLGHVVVGLAGTAKDALDVIDANSQTIDAAILDINLAGAACHEVADTLVALGIPFIVTTGYDPKHLPQFEGRSILQKPFLRQQFERAFQSLEAEPI